MRLEAEFSSLQSDGPPSSRAARRARLAANALIIHVRLHVQRRPEVHSVFCVAAYECARPDHSFPVTSDGKAVEISSSLPSRRSPRQYRRFGKELEMERDFARLLK